MSIEFAVIQKNDRGYIIFKYQYFIKSFIKTIDYVRKKVYNYKEIKFLLYGGLTQ